MLLSLDCKPSYNILHTPLFHFRLMQCRPTLFTFAGQWKGIGVIGPLYYFFLYAFTPIEKFKATDMRLTKLNYSLAVLPTLLLAYAIPTYAMLYWSTLSGRQTWLFFWQMFPIWMSLTQRMIAFLIPNTYDSDRLQAPKRDLPVMRYTIGSLVTISASVWIWINATSPYSVTTMFFPEAIPSQTTGVVKFARDFLKIDEISLFGSTLLWLGYAFWDMKSAGMVETSWAMLILYALVSLMCLGPGATVGLGWLWREDIITNKRHKDAITEKTAKERSKTPAKLKAQ